MSADLHLALRLEGPLQSWGFEDRFTRRGTGLLPTKSGIIGLCCAALGIARGSDRESRELPRFAGLSFTAISGIPGRDKTLRAISRMEDYHTVLGTRSADGKMKTEAVLTYRSYLCDARNGAILSGDADLLQQTAAAIENPVWGLWLGRKACIPSAPVFAGLHLSEAAAVVELLGERKLADHLHSREAATFDEGTDSLMDQPASFLNPRTFFPRRIHLHRPISST